MADDRTDEEANAQDNDGADLFTASTPTPRSPAGNVISQTDEALFRALKPYAYRDMRAHWWMVRWTGSAWAAFPLKETAASYNAEFGTKLDTKRMYAAATDARGLIAAVEANVERDRLAKSDGGGWVWLLVAWVLLSKKGRK